MKYILIECKQYHELSGEVKKKVKEEVEMMFPELTTREKADLLWTTDGVHVPTLGREVFEMDGLIDEIYEALDESQEQALFNTLTNNQETDKIISFLAGCEKRVYLALDDRHGSDYHDDVLMCDPATENSDMELRQILLNIWENKENLKFNKQVEELKFYE